jgi:hypothetical protein
MTDTSTEAAKPFERIDGEWCCVCGRDPCSGLDCGTFLLGQTPRRSAAPKPAEVVAEIRARAWATRRAKYGERGHK